MWFELQLLRYADVPKHGCRVVLSKKQEAGASAGKLKGVHAK